MRAQPASRRSGMTGPPGSAQRTLPRNDACASVIEIQAHLLNSLFHDGSTVPVKREVVKHIIEILGGLSRDFGGESTPGQNVQDRGALPRNAPVTPSSRYNAAQKPSKAGGPLIPIGSRKAAVSPAPVACVQQPLSKAAGDGASKPPGVRPPIAAQKMRQASSTPKGSTMQSAAGESGALVHQVSGRVANMAWAELAGVQDELSNVPDKILKSFMQALTEERLRARDAESRLQQAINAQLLPTSLHMEQVNLDRSASSGGVEAVKGAATIAPPTPRQAAMRKLWGAAPPLQGSASDSSKFGNRGTLGDGELAKKDHQVCDTALLAELLAAKLRLAETEMQLTAARRDLMRGVASIEKQH